MSEPRAFGYARSLSPTLWMLVALGGAELLVTHLILLRWSATAAAVLSALTSAVLVTLAIAIAGFRHRPVLLTDDALVWRLGPKSVTVPRDAIGPLRDRWNAAAVKKRSVLNLAAAAHPNVVIDLARPMQLRRRSVVALAHRLDDPTAFAAALDRWRAGTGDCPTPVDRGSGAR